MNNGFTTLLLILLSHICFSFIDTKQKEIKFAPHAQYNKDTLLWTAELKHDKSIASSQLPVHSHDHQEELFSFGNVYIQSESETESDIQLAKRIAAECDLTFLGLVGQLRSIYLFGHQLGYHGDNNATHQLDYHGDSNTTHQYINIDLESVNHATIAEDIETKLDNHLNVLWFHREKVFSRARRTVHFKDPAYPKQWHLVFICYIIFTESLLVAVLLMEKFLKMFIPSFAFKIRFNSVFFFPKILRKKIVFYINVYFILVI